MKNSSSRLLWQALFFRLLKTQSRLFVFAVITVALGVALALGIRLGTESATHSLEDTLPLQSDPIWSTPVSAQGAEATAFLRDVALRHTTRVFSLIEVQAAQESGLNAQKTFSLQIVFPWAGMPPAEGRRQQCSDELSGIGKIRIAGKNFSPRLMPAALAQTSAKRCRVAVIDPQSLSEDSGLRAALVSELAKTPVRATFRLQTDEEKKNFEAVKSAGIRIPGFEHASGQRRIDRLKDVTRSFRTNLQLMGFIALFIGFAMVHHIFSLIIAKQAKTLSTLSALGISLRRQSKVLLALACLLGFAASTVGTLLGLLTGSFLSWATSATVMNLYDSLVDASGFYWQADDLLYGFVLGFAACVLGSVHPILKVRSLPVAQIMRDGSFESHQTGLSFAQAGLLAISITAFSAILLQFTFVWNRIPVTALAACLGFLVVSALFAQIIAVFLYRAARLKSNDVRWPKNLRLYLPPQTAVVIQVLTLTFTLTFGVKGMAESFRRTVADWSVSSLKADLWIRAVGGGTSFLPDSILRRLEMARGKEALAIDSLTILPASLRTDQSTNAKPVLFANAHMADQARVTPMHLLLPEGADKTAQSKLAKSIADSASVCAATKESPCLAYISEPVQVHFSLKKPLGAILCPEIMSRTYCFKVIAVYQDFGSDQGVILSDKSAFERLGGTRLQPSFANIYLSPEFKKSETSLERELRKLVQDSDGLLGFETLDELQKRILETFDNTFRVTDALYVLCGIIAIIATISCLNMQILLRRREWNIQWALGIGSRELSRRFAVWSAVMATLAAAVSILGGVVLSATLVYAVNYYSFGYSLSLEIPWHLPVAVLMVAAVSGYLSGKIQSRALTQILSAHSIVQE
ncbi:MAG: ABC transporter permease [Proteobacteria bacterium]|nr:ABC transporter permease [Pseudomonadota bacterium]